jgi:ribonuclease HII
MERAVSNLSVRPQYLLIDARALPNIAIEQEAVVKGDSRHFCIAAASIIAKTHRDTLMVELSRKHPEYGFQKHKGYATKDHLSAIQLHGLCPAHRASYGALKELTGDLSEEFCRLRENLRNCGSLDSLGSFDTKMQTHRSFLTTYEYTKLRKLYRDKYDSALEKAQLRLF